MEYLDHAVDLQAFISGCPLIPDNMRTKNIGQQPREFALLRKAAELFDSEVKIVVLGRGQQGRRSDVRIITYSNAGDIRSNQIEYGHHVTACCCQSTCSRGLRGSTSRTFGDTALAAKMSKSVSVESKLGIHQGKGQTRTISQPGSCLDSPRGTWG
jgi:hypothetical protein